MHKKLHWGDTAIRETRPLNLAPENPYTTCSPKHKQGKVNYSTVSAARHGTVAVSRIPLVELDAKMSLVKNEFKILHLMIPMRSPTLSYFFADSSYLYRPCESSTPA